MAPVAGAVGAGPLGRKWSDNKWMQKKPFLSSGSSTTSASDAQRMVAITTLGMCLALKMHATTTRYAEGVLFRPSLVSGLRFLGADEALCRALDRALEIDDVATLVPEGLDRLLERTMSAIISYLRGCDWSDRNAWLNWTADYP